MKNQWSTTVSDWQGVDKEPTFESHNLVESGGVYDKIAFIPTSNNDLNNIFKELYIEGWQEGYHFNYCIWSGTNTTIVIRDSNDSVILYANNLQATAGKVFEYSQNGVTLYAIFTSVTYSISPQNTNILESARDLGQNPNILLYMSKRLPGYNLRYTDDTTINGLIKELYIDGLITGDYFNAFAFTGTTATIIIKDSGGNIKLFANAAPAQEGSLFKYSQNNRTLYALFTSTTGGKTGVTVQIGDKAKSLEYNPEIADLIPVSKVDDKVSVVSKTSEDICVSRFDQGNVLPGADHNASWVSVNRRMDESYDSVTIFANKLTSSNKFFDFYSVGKHSRGTDYISNCSNYTDYTFVTGLPSSDAIMMSIKVAAVNNIDGDNSEQWYTGGNHAYGNSGSGVSATMREISNVVRVDGNLVAIGDKEVRGKLCTIDLVNAIQGYNTCKEDGTGREIVHQKFHIEITKDRCDVFGEIVALEDVILYGPHLITGIGVSDADYFRFIGSMSMRGNYVFNSAIIPENNDNKINGIRVEKSGYYLDTECDLNYGLGNKVISNEPNCEVTSVGKAYLKDLISTGQIAMSQGDFISWKVGLQFRKK